MFNRYKTAPRITGGNALYLAERLGAEHVSDNRVVFNLIANELFSGYDEGIRLPIDNNWRRMPSVPQLLAAAETGFKGASYPFDELRLSRLKITFTAKAREVFYSAVPKLDGIVSDPSLIIAQRVVTELMEMRHRAVVEAGRQNKGIVGNMLADRMAEAVHANFLKEVSNGQLTAAYAKVAQRVADEVCGKVYDDDLATEMLSDAESLVAAARSLGGTTDNDVWKRLSSADALIEEAHSMRPVPNASPAFAP